MLLTHYNVVANIRQNTHFDHAVMQWQTDVNLAVLPFFHIYASSPRRRHADEHPGRKRAEQ